MNDIRVNFVIEQLRTLPPSRGLKIIGKTAWLRCPIHKGGNEKTPSLSINLDPRRAAVGCGYCFSCGIVHGGWKVIAETLGLSDFNHETNKIKHIYQLPMPDKKQLLATPLFLPKGKLFNGNWRGISANIIGKLNTRLVNTELGARLILPITMNDRLRGWISCAIHGEEPKYLNLNGQWVKNCLFPFDIVRKCFKNKPIYLVEGPRDALNLLQNGVAALAILGSKNWSHNKKIALLSLRTPVIYLLFDSDEAGSKAAKSIELDLHKYVKTIRIELPDKYNGQEKIDPGNLRPEQIRYIQHLITNR